MRASPPRRWPRSAPRSAAARGSRRRGRSPGTSGRRARAARAGRPRPAAPSASPIGTQPARPVVPRQQQRDQAWSGGEQEEAAAQARGEVLLLGDGRNAGASSAPAPLAASWCPCATPVLPAGPPNGLAAVRTHRPGTLRRRPAKGTAGRADPQSASAGSGLLGRAPPGRPPADRSPGAARRGSAGSARPARWAISRPVWTPPSRTAERTAARSSRRSRSSSSCVSSPAARSGSAARATASRRPAGCRLRPAQPGP